MSGVTPHLPSFKRGSGISGFGRLLPVVSADRNPRLCAAVRFQSENQVVVNTAYRAADFVPVSVRTQA